MDVEGIIQYVADTCPHVDVQRPSDGPGAGDVFFILENDTRQFPFATIVTKNYTGFDESSQLDREGVFRLNVGVSRDSFRRLFPTDDMPYDFAVLDTLLPHPTYASQSWVSVLNPSDERFEQLKPLIAEAYAQAVHRVG